MQGYFDGWLEWNGEQRLYTVEIAPHMLELHVGIRHNKGLTF